MRIGTKSAWPVVARGVSALAALVAGCSKGPEAASAASDAGADGGMRGPEAGAPGPISWECGEGVAVRVDRKDSPYPVAEAVGSGWCRVPFAPKASRTRFAFRDDMPVRMPAWGPCDDGRAGCQRISGKSWTTYFLPFDVHVQANAGGVAWMSFTQSFRQPIGEAVVSSHLGFFGELDEEPLLATYAQEVSDEVPMHVDWGASSSGLLVEVSPKSYEACDRIWLFAGAFRKDAFAVLSSPSESCGAEGELLHRVAPHLANLGASTAMLPGAPYGTALLTLLDTKTGKARAAMRGGSRLNPGGAPHAAPGGAVVMVEGAGGYPLAFVDEVTGEAEILARPEAGRIALLMGLDWSTSPPTVVWVEGEDLGTALTNVDVYASPFARTAAGIVKRKVTHLPDRYWGAGAVNAGYYVTGTDDWNKNWIIRLSDGVRWPFVIGGGRDVGAFWVTKDEIFYKTGDYAAWQASGLSESALADFLDGLERASIRELVQTPPLPRIP